MTQAIVSCSLRNETGSNACHRIRSTGHVPAIIYGHYFPNYSIEVDGKELKRIIKNHGESAILDVNINGSTYPAMIKEVQRDTITNEIIHLDLQQVNTSEKIHISVPVVLNGREIVGKSGILQQQVQKVDIECYPSNVPKFVSIDVSQMGLGTSLRIADVEFGEDISILNDMNEIIVSLSSVKEETFDEDEQGQDKDMEVTPKGEPENKAKK